MNTNILLPETAKNPSTLRTLSFARELLLLDNQSQHSDDIAIVEDMMSQIPDHEDSDEQKGTFSKTNSNLISLFDWHDCLQNLTNLLDNISKDKRMVNALDYASAIIYDDIIGLDEEFSRKSIEEADSCIRTITENTDEVRKSIADRVWQLIRETQEA